MTAASWVLNDHSKVESTVGGGLLDKVRQQVHCRFCRGKACKHEDWTRAEGRKNSHIAIKGLNSNWVEDWAVASQRPSTVLFEKYNLIEQFRENRITAVFNLQETGEHPFCGPQGGLCPESGFSYNPEKDLMPYGISHYNFPWPDMTAPDFGLVLRTVQVMSDHVSKNERFLVHCHAGLGRTGLVIACWIMYEFGLDAEETIRRVRQQRPGSIQTSRQLNFTVDFYEYLKGLSEIFPKEDETLAEYLKRQGQALHGQEGRALKYVPKIVHVIATRLLDDVDSEFSESGATEKGVEICEIFIKAVAGCRTAGVKALRKELGSKGWRALSGASPLLLLELLCDFFGGFQKPVLSLPAEVFGSFKHTALVPRPPASSPTATKPLSNGPSPPPSLSLLLSPTSSTRSARMLPPLGLVASNPSSTNRSTCVTPEPQPVLSPSRKQEAILQRVSQKLAVKTKDVMLASPVLQKHATAAEYHTAGVLLSALRLMSWDLPHAKQLEIIGAGVTLLTGQDNPPQDEVSFFLHAAKEWGDAYFTRTGLGDCSQDITEVYTQWVSELYSETTSVNMSPYTLNGLCTPPEVGKDDGSVLLSLREKIAIVQAEAVPDRNVIEAGPPPAERSHSPEIGCRQRHQAQMVETSLGLVSIGGEVSPSPPPPVVPRISLGGE